MLYRHKPLRLSREQVVYLLHDEHPLYHASANGSKSGSLAMCAMCMMCMQSLRRDTCLQENHSKPYNPLAIASIAASIVRELLGQPCTALPPTTRFYGAGIYAIYYHGSFSLYESVAQRNQHDCAMPIYVGKAIPLGGRKGMQVGVGMPGVPLFNRLAEHAESIRVATNLELIDFQCRYLVVEELFIELAERTLIQTYKPVWNACLDGFGNHDPGSGRYNGQRPGWDEVHPGRAWAYKMPKPNKQSAEEWARTIRDYLAKVAVGMIEDITIVDDGSNDETP